MKPKFKVGDVILYKDDPRHGLKITNVNNEAYETVWVLGPNVTKKQTKVWTRIDPIDELYFKQTKLGQALK